MTHYIFLAEGYYDSIEKLLKTFHGRIYANGKAKVRARVLVPIHFGINECGGEEFLKDIKSMCRYQKFDTKKASFDNVKQTGIGLKNKVFKMLKLFRLFFPRIKSIDKDLDNVESSKLAQKMAEKGDHIIACLYPIGKLNDPRYKDGTEVV
jgi:hypothetical protein